MPMGSDAPGSATQDMVLEKARMLCKEKLLGQFDETGKPLCLTFAAVASAVEGRFAKITAYLHGAIRYSATSVGDLALYGFPPQVLMALRALTRLSGEPWHEYARRLQADEIARVVKLAELECGCASEAWEGETSFLRAS